MAKQAGSKPPFDAAKYIQDYYKRVEVGPDNHYPRLMAWEFIYEYIWGKERPWSELTNQENLETTALHLGFYLANWGMFRGSSMLLNNSNLNLMKELVSRLMTGKGAELFSLTTDDFGSSNPNYKANQALFDEVVQIFHGMPGNVSWTDTLISKVLLGIWGEYPALDRFYLTGARIAYPRRGITTLSSSSLTKLADLIDKENLSLPSLHTERLKLAYPKGRLMDMAFFELGFVNS